MPKARLATLRPRVQTLGDGPVGSIGTTDQRIRGTTLQNIRKAYFEKHPLCVICLRKDPPVTRIAVELDHIIPLHQGGRDVEENRQGLCRDCHNEKTITERGNTYKSK